MSGSPDPSPHDGRDVAGRPPGRSGVWRFFLVSHGVSWAFWVLALVVARGDDVWGSPARWLVYLGGVGPPLAGAWMTWRHGGSEAIRELGRRLVDPRRVPTRWLLVAILLPPLLMAGGVAAGAVVSGGAARADTRLLESSLADPATAVGLALFILVFGPVPEEIGWRGYALDALQERWAALTASLWLGAAWALWHLPLFFMPGYYGGAGRPDAALFTTAILVNSVLYTWLYNHTRRSVLIAVAFHFMINFSGTLVEGDATIEWARTGLTAILAAAVVWRFGARSLADPGRA